MQATGDDAFQWSVAEQETSYFQCTSNAPPIKRKPRPENPGRGRLRQNTNKETLFGLFVVLMTMAKLTELFEF